MRTNNRQREEDLITIDRLIDDERVRRDERFMLDELRRQLNEGLRRALTDGQRDVVARVESALADRPKGERPSASQLLDALPRPAKPPSAAMGAS